MLQLLDLEHVPEKLTDFSDQNMLQLLDLEHVPEKLTDFSEENKLQLFAYYEKRSRRMRLGRFGLNAS
jgi:hypothetical protein